MSDETAPHDLLERYAPLNEAVEPLAELARVEPRLIAQVIELAMVMGIHAQERRDVTEPAFPATVFPFWHSLK